MPTADEFLALSEEKQEEEIKRLLHETIFGGDQVVKETAFKFGFKSPSKLYQWGSRKSDKIPRVRQLIKLMRTKNDLRILYFLNDLFEHTPYHRPKLLDTRDQDISRRLFLLFRGISYVCQTVLGLVEPDSASRPEFNWQEFKEKVISAHEQIAALEEAVRLKSVNGMKPGGT